VAGGSQKLVVAGGGTGGHLFPALAVANELRRRRPALRIEFVGGRRGIETRLVPQAGYPLRTLALSGLKGAGVLDRVAGAAAAAWGVVRCVVWMLADRPALVTGVGGYASGPAVLAARMLGVKTMLMEQNHFPGATNRWLSPRADAVCVPSEAAARRLRGKRIVTGNPVRPEFARAGAPPGGHALSLLVFGGSRGARSINRAMVEALPFLERLDPPPQIVHQTGPDGEPAVRAAYAARPRVRAEVHAFLDDMPARIASADLVVCRAGATTLAELAVAGRAAILVPFPFAADDHQRLNAEAVVAAGGAMMIRDAELTGASLAAAVEAIAVDRPRRLAMSRAATTLARPDAADRIADVAEALLDGRPVAGGFDVS
jgi:UDP-N-acetylglucosamine--N-acetylmuramyl-(pentapeptide) pyrophosphoryl-undecaprenol N-acetylglucosamine transferase